jgi:hypothetical protein
MAVNLPCSGSPYVTRSRVCHITSLAWLNTLLDRTLRLFLCFRRVSPIEYSSQLGACEAAHRRARERSAQGLMKSSTDTMPQLNTKGPMLLFILASHLAALGPGGRSYPR